MLVHFPLRGLHGVGLFYDSYIWACHFEISNYWPRSIAKQGDNALGSGHLFVSLTVVRILLLEPFDRWPCFFKVVGQTVQTGEVGQTNRHTDKQVHYLPASRSIKMHTLWKHPTSYVYSHIPQSLPWHLHRWRHQWFQEPFTRNAKRRKMFFDLDIRPFDLPAEIQVRMSVRSAVRVVTHTHTDDVKTITPVADARCNEWWVPYSQGAKLKKVHY